MPIALYNLVVKVLMVTSLVVPGTQHLLQGGEDVRAIEQSYEAAVDERADLEVKRDALRDEYQVVLLQIDQVKRQQPMTLQRRMELEELLRQSRELAERLTAADRRLRALGETVEARGQQLQATIQAEMARLEQRLASADASERSKIVASLNALRSSRQAIAAELERGQTRGVDVEATLKMTERLDGAGPDELMAAADEIEDAEDQLKSELAALDGRIQELRKAKALARRARTFSAEERFFDETSRDRYVGRYERSGSGDQANESPSQGDVAAGGGEAGAGGGAAEQPDQDDGLGAGAGAPTDGGEYGENADPSAGFRDDGMTDRGEAPEPIAESEGDYAGGDLFGSGSGSEALVLESYPDPTEGAEVGFESSGELDERIRSLEEEKERLRRQAEALEEKARSLRRKATGQ